MSAVAKSIIIAIFGLLIAIVLGFQLGEGQWTLSVGIVLSLCLAVAYRIFGRGVRLEAIVLGVLLIGYIVGNRGFAQISLAANSALFLGEMGMLVCMAAFLTRMALTREGPIPNTPLAWAIAAFLVVGGVRLAFDLYLRTGTRTMAIRDSATVYYAIFFFIAYRMGQIPSSRLFLERCLVIGFAFLLPVFAAEIIVPNYVYRLTFRGIPVLVHKGDLAGALCAIASFYLYFSGTRVRASFTRLAMSLGSFWLLLLASSRAAYVGWMLTIGTFVWAKRGRWSLYHFASLLVGLALILILQVSGAARETNLAIRLSDKMASLADIDGSSTNYRSDVGTLSAANNRFRSAWWSAVFNETMEKAPFTGLGFGYDLGKRFIRSYWVSGAGDPNIRSPHNVVVTIFGRMGIIGLLSFLVIAWLTVAAAGRAAGLVRSRRAPPSYLRNWAGVIILLVASCFGVVLEGPMGGIVFWSFLGLAASQKLAESESASVPPLSRESVPERRPRPLRRPQLVGV